MCKKKRAGTRIISGSKDWPSKTPGSYTTASCKTCSSRFVFEPPLIGPGAAKICHCEPGEPGEPGNIHPSTSHCTLFVTHLRIAHCTSQSSSDLRVAAMNISFKIPSGTDVQCCRRIGQPSQPLYRISAQRSPCRLRGAGQPVPRGPQSMYPAPCDTSSSFHFHTHHYSPRCAGYG